ncbi:EI24 domain-containing protein [Magnetovibrio sp. PR-2]|uniref:EI24 domain-containing protein n=1 Tax=Magnetovibrio sp. PR-2 TaxID=3120356 RepID=UPI002FCE34AE
MSLIISSYYKAFEQLSDPKTRSVVWKSIGLSAGLFVALFIGIHVLLSVTTFVMIGPLEWFLDVLGQFAAIFSAWYLFPPVVIAVGSLMLDKVVDAVEARHYPDRPVAPGQTLKESIWPSIKLLGSTIGLNLLCLPLLIIPPLFFAALWSLNGYLLSREYFELVANRRMTYADTTAMRKRWRFPLFIAGVGFAFMLSIPILNLFTPVIATAAVVHLFEAWRLKDNIDEKPVIHHKGGAVTVPPESTPPTEV